MTGPAKARDELISSFSSKLFSAMLHEVIMDAALQSHKDILRGKALCPVCGMRCSSAHVQAGCNGTSPSTRAPSSTLPPSSPPPTSTVASGTGIPVKDGNIYFECTNCQKKIASNRYAPHLSGCLGIGTGSRRGAARNAAAKNKLSAELDRGVSPLVGSDYGSPPHDAVNGKNKWKGKSKKINGKSIDAEVNGSHKRPNTPDHSPAKKIKKQKTSSTGSEAAILVGDGAPTKIPPAAKIPVKSGASSASPYAPGSPSGGSGSQCSGHDSPSASASHSVSSFAQSPTASLVTKPPKSYNMSSGGQHKKRGGPPSSGKKQILAVDAAALKRKTQEKGDPDFIDVEGEEQEYSSDSS